jgi:hypothetical protein
MQLSSLLKYDPHDFIADNLDSGATIPVPWSWAAGKDKKPDLQASDPLSHYPAPSSYFSLKLILMGISQIVQIFKANSLQFIGNATYPANPDRPTGYQIVLPSGAACKKYDHNF